MKLEKAVSTGEGKYVFCYFLNKHNKYRESVEDNAEKNGLRKKKELSATVPFSLLLISDFYGNRRSSKQQRRELPWKQPG